MSGMFRKMEAEALDALQALQNALATGALWGFCKHAALLPLPPLDISAGRRASHEARRSQDGVCFASSSTHPAQATNISSTADPQCPCHSLPDLGAQNVGLLKHFPGNGLGWQLDLHVQ